MAVVVGTAYVTIRALTASLKKDIEKAAGDSVRDAGKSSAVQGASRDLGHSVSSNVGQSVSDSLGDDVADAFDRSAPTIHKAAKKTGSDAGHKFKKSFGSSVQDALVGAILPPTSMMGIAIQFAGPLINVAMGALGAVTSLASALGSAASYAVTLLPILTTLGTAAAVGKIAFEGMGKAISGDAEAMAKLTPAAQDVAQALMDQKPAWEFIKRGVQEAFFSGLGPKITEIAETYLPVLNDGLTGTATQLNSIAQKFMAWAQQPAVVDDVSTALTGQNAILGSLGTVALNVADVFRNLFMAVLPFAETLAQHLATGSEKMKEFFQNARDSGALTDFFYAAQDAASSLWQIIKNLAIALWNIFKLGNDEGQGFLDTIAGITQKFADWTKSAEGVQSINEFFAEGKEVAHEMWLIVEDIASAFSDLSGSSADASDVLSILRTEVLAPILDIIKQMNSSDTPGILEALGGLAQVLADSNLLGMLATTLTVLTMIITPIAWLATHVPGVSEAIGLLVAGFGAFRAIKMVGTVISGIGTAISTAGTVFSGVMAIMKGGYVQAAIASMRWAVMTAAAWVIGLGPVAWIIAGIMAIVGVFILLWTKCEWFRDFWIAVWEMVKAAAVAVWNAIVTAIQWAWGIIQTVAQAIWDFLVMVFTAIKDAIVAAWDWVIDKVQAVWDFYMSVFQAIWDFIVGVFNGIKDAIGAAWDWVMDKVQAVYDFYKGVFEAIWNFIKGVFQKVWDWIKQVWDWVRDYVVQLVTFYKEKFEAIWNWIKDVFQKIKDFVVGVWDWLIDKVKAVYEFYKDKITAIWDWVKSKFQAIKDFVSGVWDGAKEVFDKFIGGIKSGINTIISGINVFIRGVNTASGLVSKIPGVPDIPKVPEIPKLAKGGIVGAQPGGTLALLAEAGRKERVEPLDSSGLSARDRAILARIEGRGNAEIRVFIGNRELTDIVRTEVRSEDQRTAASLVGGRRYVS